MIDFFKSFFGRYITIYKLKRKHQQGNAFYMDAQMVSSEWVAFPFTKIRYNLTRYENSNWTDVVVCMERYKGKKKNDLSGFDYEW
jgi:hypothetical protein